MQALPNRTQRHLRDCAECRELYAFERELTSRLVAEAKPQGLSPSPFLHARIMASLDRSPQSASPRRNSLRPIWATAILVVGVGLFSIPFIRKLQISAPPTDQGSPTAPVASTPQAGNLSASLSRDVIAWSKTLNEPLETEMQSVVTDAKTAIQLLASNFLPEK